MTDIASASLTPSSHEGLRRVTRRDFAGLERVASAADIAFVQGIVLYDGDQILPFGKTLRAAPFPTLWA